MSAAMRMMSILLLVAVATLGCGREREQRSAAPAPADPGVVLPVETRVSVRPAKVPRPKDQAQLDRMILAGYVPHDDHLHPPGVNECPMSMAPDPVR